jgi:Na+/H+ antiporter NhaC
MLIKATIVCLLIFIVLNLFRALPLMLKSKNDSQSPHKPMSHFFGRRLLLSIFVFALLLLAIATGLIEPNPRPY